MIDTLIAFLAGGLVMLITLVVIYGESDDPPDGHV